MQSPTRGIAKIIDLLKFQKREISRIYFYSVLNGLVLLCVPLGIQAIISFVMGGFVSTSIILLIIFVIAAVFVNGLMQVNIMKVNERIQQQLFVRYAFHYANTLPKLNLKATDDYYLPELVNRFFDTVSLQKSLSKLLLETPAASVQVLLGLLLLSFYHPIFIVFGLLLIFILYIIIKATGKRGLQTSLEESDYKYNVAGFIEELARSILSFKFSPVPGFHLQRTDHLVSNYLVSKTAHFKTLLTQYWSLLLFKVFITAVTLIAGVTLLLDQQINIGQFIAAEIVILTIINSVEKIIINLDKVYDVLTSVEKLSMVIEKPVEENGNLLVENAGSAPTIRLTDVSFGYDPRVKILKNLNLDIRAGEKICIKGKSGSGKSTLLKILTGAYTPYEGVIMINNINLMAYDKASLRKTIGVLSSDQQIFSGTLLQNITMGKEDVEAEEIKRVVEAVSLPDSVPLAAELVNRHLPARLRKKILLARALIHKPGLLLLQEPWLEFEPAEEEKIRNFLLKMENVTMLVVTEDQSFAQMADRVLIVDEGRIDVVENGNNLKTT